MKRIEGIIILIALTLLPGYAYSGSITQGPLNGIAGGGSGPQSAKIDVAPYCCPSTALEIRAHEVVSERDTQWVEFGFSIPTETNINTISGVKVCYEVKSKAPGRTYISQTRLTDMTVPNTAYIKLDDGTDYKELGPTCYVTRSNFTPDGAVSLALRVVFGDINDAIIIGSLSLLSN